MPTVTIKKRQLHAYIGNEIDDEKLDQLCFEFGLEIDENTTEEYKLEDGGIVVEPIYKIEVPANRHDLLCVEGLGTALAVYMRKIPRVPVYHRCEMKECPSGTLLRLTVRRSVAEVRPIGIAAVLRNVQVDQDFFHSFIDIQEKLHQNLGRKRVFVSIGTHDLDTIKPPFFYEGRPPAQIRFRPLNRDTEMGADEMLTSYLSDMHLKPFVGIIKDKPVYPLMLDSNGTVLSMPPIINSWHSRVHLKTRNIFVDLTSTDMAKARIALDTLTALFSEHAQNKFTVEPVEIVDEITGTTSLTPTLEYRTTTLNVSQANQFLGLKLSASDVCELLGRMCLEASPMPQNEGLVQVKVGPTRHDILHECDIIEDVGIAYGYLRIPHSIPKTLTVGAQFALNKLSDQLRLELAMAGWSEALTFSLCSISDLSNGLRQPPEAATVAQAVRIGNPKTEDFQAVRTTLLPGLLRTIAANKAMPLPIRLFEVQDVVFKDATKETGTRQERHVCALYYARAAGFEVIHGLLDRLLMMLGVERREGSSNSAAVDEALPSKKQPARYFLEAYDDTTFMKDRCAHIKLLTSGGGETCTIGTVGVLHPEVIRAFDLNMPCSVLEFHVEPFL